MKFIEKVIGKLLPHLIWVMVIVIVVKNWVKNGNGSRPKDAAPSITKSLQCLIACVNIVPLDSNCTYDVNCLTFSGHHVINWITKVCITNLGKHFCYFLVRYYPVIFLNSSPKEESWDGLLVQDAVLKPFFGQLVICSLGTLFVGKITARTN